MALRTRSRMSSDTYPLPFTTSETVLRDTPAFFATSRMPTMIAPSPLSLFYRCMLTCLPRNITFIYILSNLFDSPATKYSFLVSTPAEVKAFSSGLVWSNAITSVASGLAALMAVALRFLSRYSATVRVT